MFWSVNEIILTTKDQNIPKIERDKRAHFANCAWSQWIGHRQVGSQDKSLCLSQLTTNYHQLLPTTLPLLTVGPLRSPNRQTEATMLYSTPPERWHRIKRPSSEQLSFILSSREGVLDITVRLLNVSLGDWAAPSSDICSYLPRYLRNACASREGCDGRWGAGLGRGGRRGGQRQRHPSRHHHHGQQCHLDNHYHHQVDFSVREHTERSKAVWSTASFQLKLVRTLFFVFFFLLFIQIFIFFSCPGRMFSYCVRACAYTHVLARVYSTRASTCTIYTCFTLPPTRVDLTGLQVSVF